MDTTEALDTTIADLHRDLQQAEREMKSAQGMLAEAQGQVSALRQLIAGLEARRRPRAMDGQTILAGHFTEVSQAVVDSLMKPITSVAIKRILADAPEPMDVAGLATAIAERGWESEKSTKPLGAIRQSLLRLVNVTEEVERVGRGKYRLASPDSSEPEQPSEQPHSAVLVSAWPPEPSRP
jgi:hypothetical protein